MNRRRYLKLLLGLSGIAVLPHFIGYGKYFSSKPEVKIEKKKIANLSQLPLGKYLYFEWGEGAHNQYVLIRDLDGALYAYSVICTHAGCTLNPPDVSKGLIYCRCHGSVFSTKDGSVISTPADSPLPRVKLEVVSAEDDDEIYAVGYYKWHETLF